MRANRRTPAMTEARDKRKKKADADAAPVSRDTWPVPPPESHEAPLGHDTIPTPPPDAHDADHPHYAPPIPPLRSVRSDTEPPPAGTSNDLDRDRDELP